MAYLPLDNKFGRPNLSAKPYSTFSNHSVTQLFTGLRFHAQELR